MTVSELDLESEHKYLMYQTEKLENRINDYMEFINKMWKDVFLGFASSTDCNIMFKFNDHKNKEKFVMLMLETSYFKQLNISIDNFKKRMDEINNLIDEFEYLDNSDED